MSIRNFISPFTLTLLFLSVLPAFAYAQAGISIPPDVQRALGANRQGIFDCNQNGAYAMSVGALGATGGAFVPVADATVELNTGILVYKECVLRQVVIRQREAALSALTKKAVVATQTGRGGNPRYVVNQGREELQVSNQAFDTFIKGDALQAVNKDLAAPMKRSLQSTYDADTRAPESVLKCEYQGDLNAALTAPTRSFSWEEFGTLGAPACNPLGAYYLADDLADSRIAQAISYQRNQWDWGRGYYPLTDDAIDPLSQKVRTPAVNVQESFQTILDSPIRQLENTDDVGEMISALYAGMSTQIISDDQGLAGLMESGGGQLSSLGGQSSLGQSNNQGLGGINLGLGGINLNLGGKPSYLDQLVIDASQGLRDAVVNVGIQILTAARQVEAAYLQAVNSIRSTLAQSSAQLRSGENQCWNLIIPKVCATALAADNTCTGHADPCTTDLDGTQTCPIPDTFKVATSTAFSQPVITTQITPLASVAATNASTSQAALGRIDLLILGVSNTSSPEAQRLSLQQLDSLVSQRLIHTKPDLEGPNGILRQQENVQSAMSALVTNTVKSWADDPNPAVGWCNVNNPAVIQGWKDRWKQTLKK